MTTEDALVSICIPTYNRVGLLERAVRSCLDQGHRRIDVVVSDNASTDGTDRLLAELAAEDPRVRVLTQPTNVGATANFNRARDAAIGDYVMWLGDDDWLEPDYVSSCLDALRAVPGAALATGSVRYEHLGSPRPDGDRVELLAPDPRRRVRDYFGAVGDNGVFYGLAPRWAVERTTKLSQRFGNDWFLVAELALAGPVLAVDGTAVHREVGGATVSLRNVAGGAGHGWFTAELPQLALAAETARACWTLPTFDSLGRRRWLLGLRCAATVLRRFLPTAVAKAIRRAMGRRGNNGSSPGVSAEVGSVPMETGGRPVRSRTALGGDQQCAQ